MKAMTLLFCTLFASLAALTTASTALATQAYTGFVNKTDSSFYFTNAKIKTPHQIVTTEPEVQAALDRLSPGDLINGHGTIDPVHRTMILESIDFVGLRRLLGPWVATDGFLNFKNFQTMEVKTLRGDVSEFRYSISPADDGEWAVFLSDANRTILATLSFENGTISGTGPAQTHRACLKIFEAESGRVLRTLKLERP
jgi:hypothetical protein